MRPSIRAGIALAAALFAIAPVRAEIHTPASATPAAEPPLSLQDALAIASGDQPSTGAYRSEAAASEQAAVAAEALPDLQLTAGLQNFPITGDNAFSPTEDMMTMLTVGVMREQVRRSKREAEAARIRTEALVSRREASAEERRIRRDVMLAWIDAVEAGAKQDLLRRMVEDLEAGKRAVEAGVQTGASTPALALEMDAEIALQEAQLAKAKKDEASARGALARWIGAAADRPLPNSIPAIEIPAALPLQAPFAAHPMIQVAQAQEQAAQGAVQVAREGRKPDISWSVMLGIRPKYGEMVSGTISIPLQLDRRNKQDRQVAEAELKATAAALRIEDARRDLKREYRMAQANYQGSGEELEEINSKALPALEAAFKAAEARYAAGGGTLDKPFEIVRDYIETSIKSVEARASRARAAARIIYIIGEAGQ